MTRLEQAALAGVVLLAALVVGFILELHRRRPLVGYHQDFIVARLDAIRAQIAALSNQLAKESIMTSSAMQAVIDKVAAQTTLIGSAKTLLGELSAKISALAANPNGATQAELASLAASIDANDQTLSDAVVANTPAAPPAPPAP